MFWVAIGSTAFTLQWLKAITLSAPNVETAQFQTNRLSFPPETLTPINGASNNLLIKAEVPLKDLRVKLLQ